tara:strand:- start:212 stop:430 length:219 start_codon:yes stop_codon:yes gene_type:complete
MSIFKESSEEILSMSGPKVMQSAAGFYIGESCVTKYTYEDGESMTIEEPWDRYTEYFATKEAAENIMESFYE